VLKRILRLTGGSFSGQKLWVPDSGVRPATNLVREALFSTIYSFFDDGIRGLDVLDLFAGSGSLGIEAISRGAKSATFVDNSIDSVRAIHKNLEFLNLDFPVIRSDVVSFLKRRSNLLYDVIFLDPPYKYEKSPLIISLLKKALQPECSPILEYERFYQKEPPDFGVGDTGGAYMHHLRLLKRKKYGQTEVLWYKI